MGGPFEVGNLVVWAEAWAVDPRRLKSPSHPLHHGADSEEGSAVEGEGDSEGGVEAALVDDQTSTTEGLADMASLQIPYAHCSQQYVYTVSQPFA